MNVLIIGANGKIGRQLTSKLKDSEGFEPIAFLRKQEQVEEFKQMNVSTSMGNLEESVEKLADAFQNADAIVFTAGSGGSTDSDKTLSVDLDGAVKSMEAAEKMGVKRFVMVSASHADNREFWDKSGIKSYYIAKHYADRFLKQSDLNYTILRPVMLTDDDGHEKITASENPDRVERKIPREDVASVIVNLLKDENSYRKTIELSSGEKEIEQALQEAMEA